MIHSMLSYFGENSQLIKTIFSNFINKLNLQIVIYIYSWKTTPCHTQVKIISILNPKINLLSSISQTGIRMQTSIQTNLAETKMPPRVFSSLQEQAKALERVRVICCRFWTDGNHDSKNCDRVWYSINALYHKQDGLAAGKYLIHSCCLS